MSKEICSKCNGEIISEITRQEYNAFNAYCEERYMTLSTVLNFCECDLKEPSYLSGGYVEPFSWS